MNELALSTILVGARYGSGRRSCAAVEVVSEKPPSFLLVLVVVASISQGMQWRHPLTGEFLTLKSGVPCPRMIFLTIFSPSSVGQLERTAGGRWVD